VESNLLRFSVKNEPVLVSPAPKLAFTLGLSFMSHFAVFFFARSSSFLSEPPTRISEGSNLMKSHLGSMLLLSKHFFSSASTCFCTSCLNAFVGDRARLRVVGAP